MNISSEISSTNKSNSSGSFFSNDTAVNTDSEIFSLLYGISVLFGFPINSYVIWLIVRGTGNGLAAEFFILNLSVCNILVSLESLLISLANKFEIVWVLVGFVDGLVVTGHPLFQCLICVERYLAVVHPVTFLKLKPLRYRLMCSAVSWVAIFVSGGFDTFIWLFLYEFYLHYVVALFLPFFSIQLFCCAAVLRALKQSGPGERGREREEENHMKKRAFHLILINTVTTVIISTPYTIILCLPATADSYMYLFMSHICFIFAGLVEPVFFLYRIGKLNFIRCQ